MASLVGNAIFELLSTRRTYHVKRYLTDLCLAERQTDEDADPEDGGG